MDISSFLVSSHVLSGLISFLLGIVAMVSKKGGPLHRGVGKGYVLAMAYLFISALLILYFVRYNFFLMVIAILSFYAAFSGMRATKRKEPGTEQWFDWVAAILLLTSGICLLGYGLWVIFNGNWAMAILSGAFGWLSTASAVRDIRIFRETERKDRMWWWYSHMGSMLGSYIALITAFLVNNMPKWLPEFEHQWIFWILPAVLIVPLNVRWEKHYRAKFAGQKK